MPALLTSRSTGASSWRSFVIAWATAPSSLTSAVADAATPPAVSISAPAAATDHDEPGRCTLTRREPTKAAADYSLSARASACSRVTVNECLLFA